MGACIAIGVILGVVGIRGYRRGWIATKLGTFRRQSEPFGFWVCMTLFALVTGNQSRNKKQSRMNLLSVLRNHQRWFLVGCIATGAAVSRLPILTEPNGNTAVLPYLATWLACGFLAGMLVPDRPWRWGLAMAIGQPIAGIVVDAQMALLALVTVPLLPVAATPIVIGAYLGKLVSPLRMATPAAAIRSTPAAISSRLFLLFAVGLVTSVIPVFFAPNASRFLLILWAGTAGAVAATSVGWARSGILAGTGIAIGVVIVAFMAAVIYDTSTGGPNHHMLPFEMMYVIVATSVPAALLALLTHWLVGRVPVRPKEG